MAEVAQQAPGIYLLRPRTFTTIGGSLIPYMRHMVSRNL